MAFFSEIKARLGLDITPFEKGLSQAQGSLGKVLDGATGKLGNLKNVGTTLATAVGLNLETIAEGVARLVVGFSKAQEAALLELVESSKAAADDLAKIASKRQGNDDPATRIKNLDKEAESLRQQVTSRTKLTTSEKQGIINQEGIIAGILQIKAEEYGMEKAKAAAQKRLGEISREQLKASDEIKDAAAKKEKDNIKEVVALNDQTAKTKEAARQKALSLDEKIAEANAKINAPVPVASGSQEEIALKRAQDKLEKAKAAADLADLLVDKKKQEQAVEEELLSFFGDVEKSRASAEKKRTDELKAQQKTLLDQKTTIEQTLAAQAKASVLPTMKDVVSGKRNIGGVARGRATQLERDRASALDLADAEQRAREELAGASGPFAAQDALKSGRAIRAQLDQTRSRITTNENLLGSRISDANPNAKMEEELMLIKTELQTLNNITLAPQNTK